MREEQDGYRSVRRHIAYAGLVLLLSIIAAALVLLWDTRALAFAISISG